jgi:hypothetical protein
LPNDVDAVGGIHCRWLSCPGEDQKRSTDLNAVAAGQCFSSDPGSVDERSVAAGKIDQLAGVFVIDPNLGVPSRCLAIE